MGHHFFSPVISEWIWSVTPRPDKALLLGRVGTLGAKYHRYIHILGGCATSGEPGEAANQAGLGPPPAKPEGVARSDEGESDEESA